MTVDDLRGPLMASDDVMDCVPHQAGDAQTRRVLQLQKAVRSPSISLDLP